MVANAASGLSRWPALKRPKVPSKDCAVSMFVVDASSSTLLIPKANVPRVKNDQAAVGLAAAVAAVGLAEAGLAAAAAVAAAAPTETQLLLLNNVARSTIDDVVVPMTAKVLPEPVAVAAAAVDATRTGMHEDAAATTIGMIDSSPNVFAVKPSRTFGSAGAQTCTRAGLPFRLDEQGRKTPQAL